MNGVKGVYIHLILVFYCVIAGEIRTKCNKGGLLLWSWSVASC